MVFGIQDLVFFAQFFDRVTFHFVGGSLCLCFWGGTAAGDFQGFYGFKSMPIVVGLPLFFRFSAVFGQVIVVPWSRALAEIVGVAIQDFLELSGEWGNVTDRSYRNFGGRRQPLWGRSGRFHHVQCIHTEFHFSKSRGLVDDAVHGHDWVHCAAVLGWPGVFDVVCCCFWYCALDDRY